MGDPVDNNWGKKSALTTRVIQNFRTLFLGHEHTFFEQFSGLRMDDTAQLSFRVLWITELNRLGFGQHQRHEPVGHTFLYENAFDGCATLARITSRPGNSNGCGLF